MCHERPRFTIAESARNRVTACLSSRSAAKPRAFVEGPGCRTGTPGRTKRNARCPPPPFPSAAPKRCKHPISAGTLEPGQLRRKGSRCVIKNARVAVVVDSFVKVRVERAYRAGALGGG